MEIPPFVDVFPIKNGDIPLLCLLTGGYNPSYPLISLPFIIVQEISNRTHWTDPEKTWVSNSSIATYLWVRWYGPNSIFDGYRRPIHRMILQVPPSSLDRQDSASQLDGQRIFPAFFPPALGGRFTWKDLVTPHRWWWKVRGNLLTSRENLGRLVNYLIVWFGQKDPPKKWVFLHNLNI